MKFMPERAPEIRFLTLQQIDEQLDALKFKPQLQTMVALYIYAGLRREEALWLTTDDIDFKTGLHGMIRAMNATISIHATLLMSLTRRKRRMASFYHIMLEIPGKKPTDPEIIEQLDKSIDWYRYRHNCWIIYTTSTARKLYARFEKMVHAFDGRIVILKLDISDRQGWITKGLWDWLSKDRSPPRPPPLAPLAPPHERLFPYGK